MADVIVPPHSLLERNEPSTITKNHSRVIEDDLCKSMLLTRRLNFSLHT